MSPTVHKLLEGGMMNKDLIATGEARLILGRAIHKSNKPIHKNTLRKLVELNLVVKEVPLPLNRYLVSRKKIERLAKNLPKWVVGKSITGTAKKRGSK